MGEAARTPVLWHLGVSHYNEKARWALAFKGIEHQRRAPTPGAHMLYALWLTRGSSKTFPILELDGRAIADSTAIIAALEERHPEPPLYPEEAGERRRALALEDWFDEEVGPAVRLLGWHELTRDRGALAEIAARDLPRALRDFGPARAAAARLGSGYVRLRYGVQDAGEAERARATVAAALDRLEAELGEHGYLVGDRFTVADLTAAALLYPLVIPAGGPRLPELPAALEEFRASLRERPGYRWVEEMFRLHRRPQAAAAR